MNIKEIERRIAAIKARCPAPPTFEQFREEWGHMDGLSKSLYECALSCPEMADGGKYWQTIKTFLLQMGVEPGEPFSLADMAAALQSDR